MSRKDGAAGGKKARKNGPLGSKSAKKKRGRPSAFKPEYLDAVRKLALLGATEEEMADFLGVSVSTIAVWKRRRRDFLQALKEGKTLADANVAERLYQRALGYSHRAVKIFCDPKTGATRQITYTEHYPPDTAACKLWLTNRRRGDWKEKMDVDLGKLTMEEIVAESWKQGGTGPA